jgi:phosphoglycerol transferase MdoB-like AlkP superfamily enzyme
MSRLDIHSLFSEEELLLAGTQKVGQEDDSRYEFAPSPHPAHASAKSLSVTGAPLATEVTNAAKHTNSPKGNVSPSPVPIDASPNIMDFDFDALANQERDKTIQKLHRYFATVTPTNKNKYTGMFKGYNLIMITAEGFSPYAISKEKTPTLYRLVREGFVFNQFYTALWQTSTSDGEYVAMTGLIPSGTRSMYLGRKNLWPMSLGHQFNLLGVESKAYHNHTYTYYQRNETHTNLGYLWKAKGNGLELPTDCWPESDLEMMDATVEEYTDEEQFHVYYLTVSGHMNYTFTGNSIANKNRHLVEDLPYSNDVKAYIACQMELDMALEKLIAKLNEAGVADRTVIALSADHYPYGWEKNNLDELAGHEIDPVFEIYKNHFILWCQGMKESIVIDKPCSSLDILPTLSNLFGLSYDSRLLMGRDILSDAEPLVILSNRSFITDQVMYDSASRKTTHLTTETLPSDYIETMNKVVKNKFMVSESVRKKDYYRYLYEK